MSTHNLVSLQTGLFTAFTHYLVVPKPITAEKIVHQLDAILQHPQIDLFPDEKRVYAHLHRMWNQRSIADAPVLAQRNCAHARGCAFPDVTPQTATIIPFPNQRSTS